MLKHLERNYSKIEEQIAARTSSPTKRGIEDEEEEKE